jgi:Iron/manganese superoxide dismutases, C-terminal domain
LTGVVRESSRRGGPERQGRPGGYGKAKPSIYIDWRNARPKYVEAFWKLANCEFVAKNMKD